MVGGSNRQTSNDPLAITRAILEGALHKANDAVYADRQQDWDYALKSFADSCALLGRCMDRTDRRDEEGDLHWQIMEKIRNSYIRRIHDIRDAHYPPTPRSFSRSQSRSRSRSQTPRSGAYSTRSSTWLHTPPRTPSRGTPPRTPMTGSSPRMGPVVAVEMKDRSVGWSGR